jgi:hypothetical protein
MKRFIGYFDLMGYTQFVMNNTTEETRRRLAHVLRDIENSLGRGALKDTPRGYIADLSQSTIKCISISDTIIYWTQDDSNESLEEFLDVCFRLNWMLNTYDFPIRGLMIYDELELIRGTDENDSGGLYSVTTMYGKGLITAHLKCDNQNWAGTCVDATLSDLIENRGLTAILLDRVAIKTIVPYKEIPENQEEEYALRLVSAPLNEEGFNNLKRDIAAVFEADNKGMNNRSNEMLANTLAFASKFREPQL